MTMMMIMMMMVVMVMINRAVWSTSSSPSHFFVYSALHCTGTKTHLLPPLLSLHLFFFFFPPCRTYFCFCLSFYPLFFFPIPSNFFAPDSVFDLAFFFFLFFFFFFVCVKCLYEVHRSVPAVYIA